MFSRFFHCKFSQLASAASLAAATFITSTLPCWAVEYPIGTIKKFAGMEIGAVYLQAVEMDPPGMMRPVAESDIHLEADIHATADNKNGFPEGGWIPYLRVAYTLTKVGSKQVLKGNLMAMTADDGPHYGENVKLMGPGKYHLTFDILPPDPKIFGRHIDKETGVAPFFKHCVTEYDFVYAGIGKKGGY